ERWILKRSIKEWQDTITKEDGKLELANKYYRGSNESPNEGRLPDAKQVVVQESLKMQHQPCSVTSGTKCDGYSPVAIVTFLQVNQQWIIVISSFVTSSLEIEDQTQATANASQVEDSKPINEVHQIVQIWAKIMTLILIIWDMRVKKLRNTPVYVKPQLISESGTCRVSVMVRIRIDPGESIDSVVVQFQIPPCISFVNLNANHGTIIHLLIRFFCLACIILGFLCIFKPPVALCFVWGTTCSDT
ncbi:AP-3 complex subunit mu, partial [Tanacetum coccineum]